METEMHEIIKDTKSKANSIVSFLVIPSDFQDVCFSE